MRNAALYVAALLLTAGVAAGEGRESFGEVGFEVGSERVALVLLPGADGEAEPFYKVGGPISDADAEEHPDCFDAAGFRYHHRACPALLQFFRQHGFDPQSIGLRSSAASPASGSGESYRERRLPPERGGETRSQGEAYPNERRYRYAPYATYGYYGPYATYGYSPWLYLDYGYGYWWPYSYYGYGGYRGYYGYYGYRHYYGHHGHGHRPGAAARTRIGTGFRSPPGGVRGSGSFGRSGSSSRGWSFSRGGGSSSGSRGAARTRASAVRR